MVRGVSERVVSGRLVGRLLVRALLVKVCCTGERKHKRFFNLTSLDLGGCLFLHAKICADTSDSMITQSVTEPRIPLIAWYVQEFMYFVIQSQTML